MIDLTRDISTVKDRLADPDFDHAHMNEAISSFERILGRLDAQPIEADASRIAADIIKVHGQVDLVSVHRVLAAIRAINPSPTQSVKAQE